MKTKNIFAVATLSFALSLTSSFANPINLIIPTDPNPFSAGQGDIESWLATVVTDYNTANSDNLPPPGSEDFRINKGDSVSTLPTGYHSFTGSSVVAITLPEDYDYIVLHWGGSAKDKDSYTVYYLGDDPVGTLFTFDAPSKQGLSWYDGFGPRTPNVPDGGTAVALLGLGLTGIALLRRKIG